MKHRVEETVQHGDMCPVHVADSALPSIYVFISALTSIVQIGINDNPNF